MSANRLSTEDTGILFTTNLVTESTANSASATTTDAVTVTFTRAQADALFGLLRQASQRSYGLLITPGVRGRLGAAIRGLS